MAFKNSETFGLDSYPVSEEWKEAVSILRKNISAKKRAIGRLESGHIPKRRRTSKATKTSSPSSAENTTDGGLGDRTD